MQRLHPEFMGIYDHSSDRAIMIFSDKDGRRKVELISVIQPCFAERLFSAAREAGLDERQTMEAIERVDDAIAIAGYSDSLRIGRILAKAVGRVHAEDRIIMIAGKNGVAKWRRGTFSEIDSDALEEGTPSTNGLRPDDEIRILSIPGRPDAAFASQENIRFRAELDANERMAVADAAEALARRLPRFKPHRPLIGLVDGINLRKRDAIIEAAGKRFLLGNEELFLENDDGSLVVILRGVFRIVELIAELIAVPFQADEDNVAFLAAFRKAIPNGRINTALRIRFAKTRKLHYSSHKEIVF
jgi:hypothetical protein